MRTFISNIGYRLGVVSVARATGWVDAAVADTKARGKAKAQDQSRRFQKRLQVDRKVQFDAGIREGQRSYGRSVEEAVRAKAGEIEAERNGYRAQWEQAERRLKVANRRLQQAGKLPVTTFV